MFKKINKITYKLKQQGTVQRLLSTDQVINEQPLSITFVFIDSEKKQIEKLSLNYGITMRTSGSERDLIAGLLVSQGILRNVNELVDMQRIETGEVELDEFKHNQWEVHLLEICYQRVNSFSLFQQTYSSCGLCGTSSIKALELTNPPHFSQLTHWLKVDDVYQFAAMMKNNQPMHSMTGAAHSAGVFEYCSKKQTISLLTVCEDIGRHNALDKALGNYWLTHKNKEGASLIAVISSRVSFEMVQKAIMSGISVLIAFGAPSDLAIKTAQRFNLTLIAFAQAESFSVYHGEWRLTE